ncbi:tRNA lysidine(34) synthetase TilS [Brevibacillus ginsengisoli]|uniref:tRNA lysidine(34) synthetase TilS n=1 Tax=Brevibacillus ginsengisoli TaxID=363854 RepID=UPI003CF9EB1E
MLLLNVRKQIESLQLLPPGEKIVVAVSGGVDSIVLLHLLWSLNERYQYGWHLYVVHLNHNFRGEESREDARFVGEFCRSIGVECALFERDVTGYMKEHQLGVQEAARLVRYDLLAEEARRIGATKVAVAHHADDQVETILFRLLRGTGMKGLAGMQTRRWLIPDQVEIVRPLLTIYRHELETYLKEQGLPFREDSSNTSRKYVRNRIRLDVIPSLIGINPRVKEHIIQLAQSVRVEAAYLDRVSQAGLEDVIVRKELNKLVINREKFLNYDLALQRRMITLILSYLSNESEWSSQHVETVLRIIDGDSPSGSIHLPDHLAVTRQYEYIHFGRHEQVQVKAASPREYCYDVIVPGTTWVEEAGVAIHTSWVSKEMCRHVASPVSTVFDADRLPDKLVVRNRKAGDRMSWLGLNGHKKLKDLMIDQKIPQALRDTWPVLVAGNNILWLPSVKRSSQALVQEESSRILYVEVEFLGEDWREVT